MWMLDPDPPPELIERLIRISDLAFPQTNRVLNLQAKLRARKRYLSKLAGEMETLQETAEQVADDIRRIQEQLSETP